MLSALITTEHSYPAMLLAEQLVHQRFVRPGPLVTFPYITISVDYIFALLDFSKVGYWHIIIKNFLTIRLDKSREQVVTGLYNLSFYFFSSLVLPLTSSN